MGKANVVADAFSRKERVKPRRVREMPMTIRSSVTKKILAAECEASKDGTPLIGDVRTIIMDETHASRNTTRYEYDLSSSNGWTSEQTVQTLEEMLRACGIDFESDKESWTFSQDEDDTNEETGVNDDSEETESNNDGYDLTHPNLSTYKADDEEEEEEKAYDDEVSSDQRVFTINSLTDEEENQEGDDEVKEGEVEQEEEELYRDLNINLQRSDAKMIDAQQKNVQANQVTKDTHMTLAIVPPASKTLVNVPVFVAAETPSSDTTIPQPPISNIQPLQQTPGSTTTTTIPTMIVPDIPNFASLFQFDQRVSALETKISEFKQTSQFADAVSLIPGIVDNYLASKMKGGVGKSAQVKEHGQTIDDLEEQTHQEFNIGNDDVTHVREALDDDESQWNPSSSPTPDRERHKTKTVDNRPPQPWITQMAQAAGTQSSFNEFLATPIDFSTFIMNRLKIDNLTQEVLIGPTYDLIKDTCKSVTELEYHLEEVFKAINDRLDWHNPEGKLYPYDLSKPLPLIQNELTSLKIMKYFGYNHLEEIIVRRQDDQLYKFREDEFKKLRRQEIEDMLLFLVQSKLSNLNLEERYALNVALRIFTRGIIIQERVEDLQLEVESYQKKINLKKPDTYRLDLRRMTPYTAYPNIQGIIYEDEMNRNRLMRTDELHKFSDSTLNHVCTALNDIATGIEMDYLPKRKWSKHDKQRARVMINAIDKKLRDRRLMRNLQKFVSGRPYGGDLWLFKKTI
uniref:Reverse transcriptase domain-containing protein n=1 Tax=Tanacetum cinerariifolium TaxID=118510 RepID=A0A6L2MJS6_TANCI|nr:hypothetical protein [Tanacetum cinerariifolium]